MTRSKLENSCNLGRTSINFENYKKQRNICVNLLRKSKKQYFNNIDVKNVMDNKKFWRTIRPKLSKKCKTTKRIILVENHSVQPTTPFCWGAGGGGCVSDQIFKKGGSLAESQFLEGSCWERGGQAEGGRGCRFYLKNKLKFEISDHKKGL